MEDSMGSCLFCRDKIIPYSLSSQESIKQKEENNLPNFRELCNILDIKFTGEFLKQLRNVPSFCSNTGKTSGQTCEKFLCLCCFEMVDTLTKLSIEMKEIQQKVSSITSKIRSVIINPSAKSIEIETPLSRRRGRSRKTCIAMEFREAFQTIVKESQQLVEPAITEDKDKMENPPESLAGKQLKKKEKSLKRFLSVNVVRLNSHNDSDERTAAKEQVKVEVEQPEDEDDLDGLNDFEHFDEDTDEVIVNTITELKEELKVDISIAPGVAQQENGQKKKVAATTEKPSKPNVVKRKRRKPIKPTTYADDSDNDAPSCRKKRKKGKLTLAAQNKKLTCRNCNAVFHTVAKYYDHRRTHVPLSGQSLDITSYYQMENDRKILIRVCSICNHKVKGKMHLFMEHMLSHENTADPSSQPLSCDMCDKQFMLKLNLDLHKKSQHDWNRVILKCELCGDSNCKSQDDFVAHLKSHGSEITVHCCKSCQMACTSLGKVLAHMTKHTSSKRLSCPECTWFVSTTLKELFQHCNEVHPELMEEVKCDHCQKSLLPGSLPAHLKLIHGIGIDDNFGSFVCKLCSKDKVYKSKVYLERHILNVHGDEKSKIHKCDQCQESFLRKSLLQRHIEKKHEKIRYPCPHCPKSYTESNQLNYHMRIHTGEGLFTCDTCGSQFPRRQQLKVHSYVHLEKTEQTKCVCDVCGKEFSNALRLRSHKKIHEEKKLKCQHCDLMFLRQDHLRGHLRTHTGERPFVCPVCTKGFNRRDILLIHMTTHGFSKDEAAKVYDKHVENMKQENLVF